jgi:pantoate--beta-alanine ligase
MRVLERVGDVGAERPGWGQVGLVPTMGYLHEGHLALLRAARAASETLVMSLFVNPAQFGPSEDFGSYPRDTERDLRLAREFGVDVVFMPSVKEVYPPGFDTWVEVGSLAARWEGERRPGHFRGVATVVLKLFQVVRPTLAYFGEKDYQQLLVIKKMVTDLDLPVDIVACPTVREPSGLAFSSRNAYLSADRRLRAAVLYRAMKRAQQLAASGEGDVGRLLRAMEQVLVQEQDGRVDYLALVEPQTLEPLERLTGDARILGAMHFHGVRLIDNLQVRLG